MQQKESQWHPVAYASRSVSETEQRYVQIEKEALAATWACEKFPTYVIGMKFLIETDHKPLVPLLGEKHLDSLPPRILRFTLRLNRFDYSITYVPGKLLYTADTLSRSPSARTATDSRLQDEAQVMMGECTSYLLAGTDTLVRYQKEQEQDRTCELIIKCCKDGWSRKEKVQQELRPYFIGQGQLTVNSNGLLLYGKRIVVPTSLQRRTLEKIHDGHQGIQRGRLRAMTSVWWPGINHEIQNMVQQCPTYAQNRSPRKQPLIPTLLPDYPWQKVATDLFYLNGATYLLTVDYFSRYPEIQRLSILSSQAVIEALKTCFSRYGIPEVVVSDNGPQYSSQEFASFVKDYDITHVTSSPRFPQSNGQAERAVQTVKKLLKDTTDVQMSLLVYRTALLPFCSLSPAELLIGRRLRSNIPIRAEDLMPD